MVKGEIKERNGRDKNNLHHAETPFYKGNSSDNGRDGDKIVRGVVTLPHARAFLGYKRILRR
jgi:hypothetical protein